MRRVGFRAILINNACTGDMYGLCIRNTYSMVTNVGIPTLVTMVLTGTTMSARTSASVSDPRARPRWVRWGARYAGYFAATVHHVRWCAPPARVHTPKPPVLGLPPPPTNVRDKSWDW